MRDDRIMDENCKEVSIHIRSKQIDAGGTEMFCGIVEQYGEAVDFGNAFRNEKEQEETLEMRSKGTLTRKNGRIELSYEESELTGMEGATTTVSFAEVYPNIVTMLRYGSVSTVLIFEQGKRHICAYETQIMPFEVCVQAKSVKNTLTMYGGKIELDYFVEICGAKAERTVFLMEVSVIDGKGTQA